MTQEEIDAQMRAVADCIQQMTVEGERLMEEEAREEEEAEAEKVMEEEKEERIKKATKVLREKALRAKGHGRKVRKH